MEVAFEGRSTGHVDCNRAKKRRSVWLKEQAAKARKVVLPADARAAGAE
jgi:hypothetical protein